MPEEVFEQALREPLPSTAGIITRHEVVERSPLPVERSEVVRGSNQHQDVSRDPTHPKALSELRYQPHKDLTSSRDTTKFDTLRVRLGSARIARNAGVQQKCGFIGSQKVGPPSGNRSVIVNWIFSQPVWMIGLIIVGGIMLLSCLGLLAFHRLVDHGVRREHNDVIGATLGVVGTVAAILLAFIGVATWETYGEATAMADGEAGAIANLYLETSGLPADGIREPIRVHIKNYLDIVIHQEWPKQQRGEMDPTAGVAGQNELLEVNQLLASFNPENTGQANIHAQMFRTLNDLFSVRRTRIAAANGHVSLVVWTIILLGTAATIGFTYFFGMRSIFMHLAITGSVAASLALVVLLIVVMDYPFRGEMSVDDAPYLTVMEMIDSATNIKTGR